MHTYRGADGTVFHFNSNLSGDVQVIRFNSLKGKHDAVEVSGTDLLAFVAEFVRRQRIYDVEEQSAREILGIKEE